VRARYEIAWGPRDVEAMRLNLGAALFYLDGAPPGPLTASPLPLGPTYGRAFTILWVRTYDVMHFAPGYGNRLADRTPRGRRETWSTACARRAGLRAETPTSLL